MTHVVLLLAGIVALAMQPAQMPLTTIDNGATSRIETARTVVVRTAPEWVALWKEHAGNTKPPAVEFEREMVVAVFLGTKPSGGYGVDISQVDKRDGGAVVTYKERAPGPDDIVSMALTSPFHIVRTSAVTGDVTFKPLR